MPAALLLKPLLTALAQKGLGILAGAIEAKGKAVIEDKLGVKIPDKPEQIDDAKAAELMKAQFAHEEFLITAAAKERQDYLADTQDARKRDLELHRAGYVNSRANIMAAGAGLLIVIILLIVVWTSGLNDFQKGIITLLLGRALGYIDQVFNFEFGTTRASKQKDDVITKLTKNGS